MLSFIKTLLQASAWPIQTPEPYSAFHILLCAAGIPLAVFLARRLARTGTHPVSDSSVIQAYAPLPDGKMHLHLHAGFCTFGRRHGPG